MYYKYSSYDLEDNGDQKAKVSARARQDADNRHLLSFAAL